MHTDMGTLSFTRDATAYWDDPGGLRNQALTFVNLKQEVDRVEVRKLPFEQLMTGLRHVSVLIPLVQQHSRFNPVTAICT
jgi:hypothetical protein